MSSRERADIDQASASQLAGDSQPFSRDYLLEDPSSCTNSSVQPPFYPYSVPSYPIYYHQYPTSEYPISEYPQYTSVPTSDMTMYPNTYLDMTQIPLDACTPTNANYPISNPIYPLTYSSLDPVVPQSDQTSSTAPYWPQSPMYPVLYSWDQSTMTQYSYPGQFYQPVPGYQDMALGWQDSSAYQDHQNVTAVTEHLSLNTISYPPEGDMSGFSEAPEFSDSGYQDASSGFQDTSISLQQQQQSGYSTTDTELNQVDTSERSEGDCYQRKNTENITIVAAPKPNNSPQKSEQEKPQPNSQKQQSVPNLKPVKDRSGAASQSDRGQSGYSQTGRYSRVYPSFGPYAGNQKPSPRHFPFPSGPRHFNSGLGRGRGWIWSCHSGGGSQEQRYRRPSKKKKNSKQSVESDRIKTEAAECLEEGAGNQPDVLQVPLQKLEIK
eukprot:GFUD01018213.1.p1 GENE.GFUD01018213.1~~GFUD01018213.1.p1  ORF type:complete len:486 (+),score=114.55 GFUD01018213.1:150-1460(+)